MSLERLGLTRSLAAAFTLVAIALISAAIYTWVHLNSIARANEDAAGRLVPQLARAAAIELNVTRVSLQARHAMLVSTPEDLKATLDDIAAKRALIAEAVSGFEQNVRSAKGKELFATAQVRIGEFWQVGEANLALTTTGKKSEAFAHLTSTLIPARERLLNSVIALREYQESLLAGLVQTSKTEAQQTQWIQAAQIAFIVLMLAGVAWVLNAYLRRRIGRANGLLAAMAAGDLSRSVEVDGRDEFRPMLQQLHEMWGSLHALVSQVRASTDSIATASAQVATGSQDLSARTEQAASRLQQAASSMEQLTGTVRQSSDSAQQASQLASSAAAVAARGGDVVSQVVSTMQDIHASSRKIAEITGVIDGIAFQTNILALNAAVEAARAGEQGRGFAVVAGEVRSLAQRSAEAAREIKTLISSSVEKVDSGTRLVADAGHTMSEIVSSVHRVSDIIQQISAAASEQSQGIDQVNGSVAELDGMTQQNASMVEESAAAADSLREQSHRLTQVVSTFRLAPQT